MILEKFNKLFFPHDNKKQHFKALDGLRGIAVILVILSHSSNVDIFVHEYLNFQKVGKVGVYLFFVLSAYLLDRQIALVFLKNNSSKTYWKNYFLRRFLRIYPLFITALLVYGLLTYLGFETTIDNGKDIISHMFLLKGEKMFWSIPVEFKYYFISPLIMWICHRYFKWHKVKLLLFFLIIIILATFSTSYFNLPNISTVRYFPVFIVGTLISTYELLYMDDILRKINPKVFGFIGIILLLIVLISVPFYFELIFGFQIKKLNHPSFYLLYACIWGLVLLSAKYGSGLIKKVLELKLFRFIGSISFSIYLFHMLFLDLVKKIDISEWLKIYLFLFLTIVFSSFSYLLIERPISKIRFQNK